MATISIASYFIREKSSSLATLLCKLRFEAGKICKTLIEEKKICRKGIEWESKQGWKIRLAIDTKHSTITASSHPVREILIYQGPSPKTLLGFFYDDDHQISETFEKLLESIYNRQIKVEINGSKILKWLDSTIAEEEGNRHYNDYFELLSLFFSGCKQSTFTIIHSTNIDK